METVLLVDDDAVSNFLMQELIKEQGLAQKVVSKKTVTDGLHYLTSCSTPPELVLLDLYIEDETAFDFLRLFKELRLDDTQTKIVILSGYLSDEDRKKAKAYPSVVELQIKPLEMEKLATIIAGIQSNK